MDAQQITGIVREFGSFGVLIFAAFYSIRYGFPKMAAYLREDRERICKAFAEECGQQRRIFEKTAQAQQDAFALVIKEHRESCHERLDNLEQTIKECAKCPKKEA
jgi:hypothetical protein